MVQTSKRNKGFYRHYLNWGIRVLFFALFSMLSKRIAVVFKQVEFRYFQSLLFMGFFKFKRRAVGIIDEKAIDYLKAISEQQQNEIIDKADAIIRNEMSILGYKLKVDSFDQLWSFDPLSKKKWPNDFHLKLDADRIDGCEAEKKYQWDLSRMQFLLTLAKAFYITKDDKYSNKVQEIVESWIKANAPFYGINWKNSMEVAIRASNLLLVLGFLDQNINIKTIKSIKKTIRYHFLYIVLNPELIIDTKKLKKGDVFNCFRRNNHFLFALIGLNFILPNLSFIPMCGYKQRVKKRFFYELKYHFLDDGVNFEGSTSYHSYVLEGVLYLMSFLKRSNENIKDTLSLDINQLVEFHNHTLLSDTSQFNMGDNDGGRFFVLSEDNFNDKYYIIAIYNKLFNKAIYFTNTPATEMEYAMLFGQKPNKLDNCYRNESVFKHYQTSGFVYSRNCNYALLIRSSNTIKYGSSGHHHNDQFSFELSIKGEKLFIDPGTYLYSRLEDRNLFRSHPVHNTFEVMSEGLNEMPLGSKFRMKEAINNVSCETANEGDLYSVIMKAEKKCIKYPETIGVSRTFCFDKDINSFMIIDKTFAKGRFKDEYISFFHLNAYVLKSSNNTLIIKLKDGGQYRFEVETKAKVDLSIEESEYSSIYGIKDCSTRVVCKFIANNMQNTYSYCYRLCAI